MLKSVNCLGEIYIILKDERVLWRMVLEILWILILVWNFDGCLVNFRSWI